MSTEPTPKSRKGVGGRPTDYDPSYCKVVIELGRKGKSIASVCAKLMVPRTVLFKWAQAHPEFDEALTVFRELAQDHWETIGYEGMKTKGIDSSIWNRSMAARFPHDWRESKTVDVGNKDGEAFKTQANIDVVDLTRRIADAIYDDDQAKD